MYKALVNCFNPRSVHNFHRGLEEAGCEVRALFFDWDLAGRQELLEKELIEAVEAFKPDFVFTYGWWDIGIDLDAYLDCIKKRGIFHIYWAFDDPICLEYISMPMAAGSDLLFTTVEECIPEYEKRGVKAHLLLHSGYPSLHKKVQPAAGFSHDIVLLANNYNIDDSPEHFKFRIAGINHLVRPLADSDMDLKVWGLWWRHTDRAYTLPEKYYGGILPADHEPLVYSSCKIALGLQSVGTSKTHFSVRTFEVLACGTFHLSQYTPSLETYFKKGIHMEWSKSAEETLEIIKFYLKRDSARERIAVKGQQEVYEKHTLAHRGREVVEVVRNYV